MKRNQNTALQGQVLVKEENYVGMETTIYRQLKGKIVIFPMCEIGEVRMDIKEVNTEEDIYNLLYQVEEFKDTEYIRTNKMYAGLNMEMTAGTHGYKEVKYHLFHIELDKTESSAAEIIDYIVEAAEETFFLRDYQYIVYNRTKKGNPDIFILVNDVSVRGEKISNRLNLKKKFIKELSDKVRK